MTPTTWKVIQDRLRSLGTHSPLCWLSEGCRLTLSRDVDGQLMLLAWVGDDPFILRPSNLMCSIWAPYVYEELTRVRLTPETLRGSEERRMALLRQAYAIMTQEKRERLSQPSTTPEPAMAWSK